MSNPPRVEVEWVDIEDDPRWQSLDDAAARECPICHTAGWLIADRPDTVVVAPSINCTDCSTTTIPRGCIRASVRQALNEPWQRRRYDVLGILGQWLYSFTGVGRGVNRGNRYYCSERVRSHLVDEAIPLAHPSPADLDKYFEGSPDWQCYGVYDPELEAKRESA
jgi:hypothetical protein